MAAPQVPYAPPNALGRIAATARRFNCSIHSRKLWLPALPPAVLWLLLCGALRSWCSTSTPKRNVRICSTVYVYASQKPMLPQSRVRASQKSTSPQSHFHALARTSPDTLCRCVCHGSAPFVVGCGTRQGKRCRDAGSRVGDGQPPPPIEPMTAGEAGRELAALLTDLYFEGQARCPFGRLVLDCSLQFNGQG